MDQRDLPSRQLGSALHPKPIVGQADTRQRRSRLHLVRALARPSAHHDALDTTDQMRRRRCQVADGFHRPIIAAAQLLSCEAPPRLPAPTSAAASAGAL
jgi:hypothetical protein